MVVNDFSSLGLIDALSAAVAALGYEEPTPVQREAIPLLIAKRDLLAQAATGTGKTAAFALPMLQHLAEHGADAASRRHVGGLVLVPTRELSMQVAEAIYKYAKGLGIRVAAVYGGASMQPAAIRARVSCSQATGSSPHVLVVGIIRPTQTSRRARKNRRSRSRVRLMALTSGEARLDGT
jgi:ATP-dependent RNA helicase DeaD